MCLELKKNACRWNYASGSLRPTQRMKMCRKTYVFTAALNILFKTTETHVHISLNCNLNSCYKCVAVVSWFLTNVKVVGCEGVNKGDIKTKKAAVLNYCALSWNTPQISQYLQKGVISNWSLTWPIYFRNLSQNMLL